MIWPIERAAAFPCLIAFLSVFAVHFAWVDRLLWLARTFGGVQGQRGAATSWSAAPLSFFRAAPIANWQEAGLPKAAFASNGITALGLIPFHQKGGRATPRGKPSIDFCIRKAECLNAPVPIFRDSARGGRAASSTPVYRPAICLIGTPLRPRSGDSSRDQASGVR